MGGYGSGMHNHIRARRVVEDCLTLSTKALIQCGNVRPGVERTSGRLYWRRGGETFASISYEFWDTEIDSCLLLKYKVRGVEVELPVPATSRPVHFGGARLYLLCPLCSDERILSKLYLPPHERYFGCRRCHDLTYQSAQESRRFDRLCRLLAGDTGFSPEQVRRSLGRMSRL